MKVKLSDLWLVLWPLLCEGPASMRELSVDSGLRPLAIVKVLQFAEREGWVHKNSAPGKPVMFVLTPPAERAGPGR